jgi:integrase
MSVYRGTRQRTYRYKFRYARKPYRGNTYQQNETDARLVEAKKKLELRQRRGGIAEPGPAPTFTEWAGVYYGWVTKRRRPPIRRPEKIDELLRVVLRFWGARPSAPSKIPADEECPYHDLTLQDPIDNPSWILEFDEWMDRRGIAGGTRNHYNTTLRRLYVVALLPEYRQLAGGLTMNPFAGRPREPLVTRKVALTPALVLTWLEAMSYHARLAVAIAALAPKLRLRNVLELRWQAHLDRELTTISAWNHKSVSRTEAPLVVPISAQLRTILQDARTRHRRATHVVTYRGAPVHSIRSAIRAAAKAAGIRYGRDVPGGVTFHTLRHTASTILARLGVNPWLHRDVLGHQDLATTDGYTHLQLEEQRAPLEQLSAALPIAPIVMRPERRASRVIAGAPGADTAQNAPESTRMSRRSFGGSGRPFARKVR